MTDNLNWKTTSKTELPCDPSNPISLGTQSLETNLNIQSIIYIMEN